MVNPLKASTSVAAMKAERWTALQHAGTSPKSLAEGVLHVE